LNFLCSIDFGRPWARSLHKKEAGVKFLSQIHSQAPKILWFQAVLAFPPIQAAYWCFYLNFPQVLAITDLR
jgi:hypothetical protein